MEDVLLGKVAKAFQRLATSILQHISTAPSTSNSTCRMPCRRLLERLLLLHSRSEDALAEFSKYYCFRLLVDTDSPLATYFIDLFHELEWLLEALTHTSELDTSGLGVHNSMRDSLSENLYRETSSLQNLIMPAVDSCRHLFVNWACPTPPTYSRSSYELMMKREAKPYRDFAMDDFRSATKMLSFVNLDGCSDSNRVELEKKLGEGSYGAVYEGKFVTWKNSNQAQRITGEPVAIKVFRSGEDWTHQSAGSCESGGYPHTDQMGKMQNFKGIAHNTNLVTAEWGKMHNESAGLCESGFGCGEIHSKPAGSYKSSGFQFLDQMERMLKVKGGTYDASLLTAEEMLLSEELWKLVSAKHPNIVRARGYIGKRPQGESGLVMELMSMSLRKYLEQVEEPLEEPEMVDLMLEIAKGMRFLHECDLVHQDLKPENILLRSCTKVGKWDKYPAMEVKLADFGLTQRIISGVDGQGSGKYTTPVGTPCYMAPEVLHLVDSQISDKQDKVDVFSYGTTCFNILTCKVDGALEFTQSCCRTEFYESVKSNEWRAWVKGKPEYLIELIARCWDFDPSRRPTFASICSLLQRAMLCILASPVINVRALSYALSTSDIRENLYYKEALMRIRDVQYPVKGTHMMESCLKHLTAHGWGCNGNAPSFLKELRKAWSINTASAVRTRANTGAAIWKLLSRKKTTKLRRLTPRGNFAVIDEENAADGSNTSSSTVVIQVEPLILRRGARFFWIPLTALDLEWVVPQALVCCSIFYESCKRRSNWWSKPTPWELFPFQNDDARTALHVDQSLVPFLTCFLEGGYKALHGNLFDPGSSRKGKDISQNGSRNLRAFSFSDLKGSSRKGKYISQNGSRNLRAFSFSDLKGATQNFQPDRLLGEGGFGRVYKGWIDEQTSGARMVIAVKKLNTQGLQLHTANWLVEEVLYLGQLCHENLVQLIGYCVKEDQRLLVYEYMQRGSLENHLFRPGGHNQALSWAIRMKIAVGVARGLAFLHEAERRAIYRDFKTSIYRDFKTSNILLDAEYNAKLSNFGLTKDGPTGGDTHVSTRVMGTYVYAAPELLATGHLTAKSDVYSFGVVLLEILTGRRAFDASKSGWEKNLVEWALPYLNNKQQVFCLVDPRLQRQYSMKGACRVASLALSCLNPKAKLRPSMKDIVGMLEPLLNATEIARHSHGSGCSTFWE